MTSRKVPEQNSRKTVSLAATQREERGFTRLLAVETVPDTGLEITICADAGECAAVAEEAGLVAVHSLAADFLVLKQDRSRFRVNGVLRARVTQTCVVSLEPFETEIGAEIGVDFAPVEIGGSAPPKRHSAADGGVAAPLPVDLETTDAIIDGRIDLGALAVEFMILNLDIYPRKPGISFEGTEFSDESSGENSPFAALQKLKRTP